MASKVYSLDERTLRCFSFYIHKCGRTRPPRSPTKTCRSSYDRSTAVAPCRCLSLLVPFGSRVRDTINLTWMHVLSPGVRRTQLESERDAQGPWQQGQQLEQPAHEEEVLRKHPQHQRPRHPRDLRDHPGACGKRTDVAVDFARHGQEVRSAGATVSGLSVWVHAYVHSCARDCCLHYSPLRDCRHTFLSP